MPMSRVTGFSVMMLFLAMSVLVADCSCAHASAPRMTETSISDTCSDAPPCHQKAADSARASDAPCCPACGIRMTSSTSEALPAHTLLEGLHEGHRWPALISGVLKAWAAKGPDVWAGRTPVLSGDTSPNAPPLYLLYHTLRP